MSTSIPQTMRAIVVEETGGPEVLLTKLAEPLPSLKANEVLVKNTLAGINYIDTYFRTGQYPSKKPEILGREAAGIIADIGDSVDDRTYGFKKGDRVVWTNWTGGYAEYVAVPADKVVKLPDGVSDEAAAGGLLMGLTALSLLRESYEVKKGDTILIHAAAGGTGLLMTQVAKAIGAKVIGTAGGSEKVQTAKDNGADEVIDYKTEKDWPAKVLELTNGAGVDAVFDGVGKDTYDGSLDVIKRKGTVVFFGASSGPVPDISLRRLTSKNSKLLRPTMALYTVTPEENTFYTDLFFEHLKKGTMKVKVHKVYGLEDVREAHVDLQARKTSGKLLLRL